MHSEIWQKGGFCKEGVITVRAYYQGGFLKKKKNSGMQASVIRYFCSLRKNICKKRLVDKQGASWVNNTFK